MELKFCKFSISFLFVLTTIIFLNVDISAALRVKRAGDFKYKLTKNQYDGQGRLEKKRGVITFKGKGQGSGSTFKNSPEIKNTFRELGAIIGVDQKAHIVSNRFGGKGTKDNLFAQNGQINQGAWKAQENLMVKVVMEENAPVISKHQLYHDGKSKRPVAISVKLKSQDGRLLGRYSMGNPEKLSKQHRNPNYRSFLQRSADKIRAKYKSDEAKRRAQKFQKKPKSTIKKAINKLKTARTKSRAKIVKRSSGKLASRIIKG